MVTLELITDMVILITAIIMATSLTVIGLTEISVGTAVMAEALVGAEVMAEASVGVDMAGEVDTADTDTDISVDVCIGMPLTTIYYRSN